MAPRKPKTAHARKGKSGRSGDASQIAEQVTEAIDLMAQGKRSIDVQRALQKAFGISGTVAWKRIQEAHEANRKEALADRADIRAENLSRYRKVYEAAYGAGSFSAALKAIERIDALFGTEAAKKVEHSGEIRTGADALLQILTEEQREELERRCPTE